jgi:hypothetical protein
VRFLALLTPVVAGVALALSSAGAAAAADPVIAAAGDIACDPNDPGYNFGEGTIDRCRQHATSDLLVGAGLAAVLPLGDIQYSSATLPKTSGSAWLAGIQTVYDPTWGRVKAITRPVLGNHETSWADYFDYFNGPGALDGPAGPRGKGWYSFDVGGWHVVALNSNCARVACTAGSEQEQWLRADLAAHPADCTLAYWHHPRFSSGHEGSHLEMQPLWEALDDAGAEILLSGHSHDYERFALQDRYGNRDPADGIRQFVVGTGGAFFTGGLDRPMPNSERSQNTIFGALFLTLHPSGYDWRFVPEAGKTFTDSGSGSCHGPGPDPPPPPAPPPPAPPPPPPGATPKPPFMAPTPVAVAHPPAADSIAPIISRLTVSPRSFAVSPRSFRVPPRRVGGVEWGTTFRYRASEKATVTVTLLRRSRGRELGGRCRPPTAANRGRRPCIRYRRVGSFTDRGAAGRNSLWFGGRIRARELQPGRFRAEFSATDAAGNRSRPKSVSFSLMRG